MLMLSHAQGPNNPVELTQLSLGTNSLYPWSPCKESRRSAVCSLCMCVYALTNTIPFGPFVRYRSVGGAFSSLLGSDSKWQGINV